MKKDDPAWNSIDEVTARFAIEGSWKNSRTETGISMIRSCCGMKHRKGEKRSISCRE